jgi:Arabinose efflux permease
VVGVLATCGLTVSLMQTLVVPLLPRFPQLLATTPATVSWLLTANLIAGAVTTPLLGRLGDMYGKRRMLLVALGFLVLGSGLAATAPDIGTLIAARALQGAGFGVISLGMSIIRDVLPPARVGAGVGLMSSSLGVGGAVGLPITGVVAHVASWRPLFAAAALFGLFLVVLVALVVPESAVRTGGRFDLIGAAGLAAALTCVLLAISKGNEWGWASPAVLCLFGGALVLFPVWGAWEWRARRPLVDLRVNARPAVLWTNVSAVLAGFSMFACFVVITQLLQAPPGTGYGFGLPLAVAGAVLVPVGVAMTVFSPLSARLSRARGARTTVLTGVALMIGGNLGLASVPRSVVLLMVATTVTASGTALVYAALPLMIMDAVPATETGSANGLNTLARMLGTSTCSAFIAAVSSGLVTDVGGQVWPATAAYTAIFATAAAAALVAGLIVAVSPAGRTPVDAPRPAEQQVPA